MVDFNQVHESDIEKLGQLRDYFASHRTLPSYSFMQQLLNMKSKETIAKLILRLKLMGFLDTAPDKKLSPASASLNDRYPIVAYRQVLLLQLIMKVVITLPLMSISSKSPQ